MASLERDTPSGRYRIRFRYEGRSFKRSLKTSDRREALSVVGRVDETLRLIQRGRIDVPTLMRTRACLFSRVAEKVSGTVSWHL